MVSNQAGQDRDYTRDFPVGLEGIGTRPVSSLGNGTEAGTGPTSTLQVSYYSRAKKQKENS